MFDREEWRKLENGAAGIAPSSVLEELLSALASTDGAARRGDHAGAVADLGTSAPAEDELNHVTRYRTLVEQIPAVVFMAYLDRGIGEAYVSPHIEKVLGFTQEEWLHDPIRWYQQIHPDDKDRWSIEAANMFLRGQPLRSVYRVLARDGRVIWFQCEVKMVLRDDGVPWFIHGVGIDVTELKEAEQALRNARDELEARVRDRTAELAQANRDLRLEVAERRRAEEERALLFEREKEARREAEAANRLKDEFLATVSHELRNPLNVIVGHTTILMRSDEAKESPVIERIAKTIHRNALAQAQLISDLLDLSRLQMRKLALELRPISFSAVIKEAIDTVRADAKAKDISLEINLPPESLFVNADPLRLEQIIWNLLNNAVKFTPAGGCVKVSLEQTGHDAKLTIADSGQGIDPEFVPHVFERFRQADSSTTRNHGGMGIGLSLVRQLVELHHGRVEAASQGVGRGAQFNVSLPIHEEVPVDSSTSAVKLPSGSLANVRVLIVDDSPDSVAMLAKLLEQEGAVAETATGGEEALRILAEREFDVIVSDISMPGMDGFELLRRMRLHPASVSVPVVALTGFGRSEDAARAKANGFISHITKPLEVHKVIEAVRDASRGRRQASATESI
jgi:PAS domain S-box-containing protein